MATVTVANKLGAGTAPRHMDNSELAYTIWYEVDLAAAATAKGSALAAADVIEVLRVPAGSQILAVTAWKSAAMTGTSTDLTFDIGITGVDVDQWVDGWDFDAAVVGAYAAPLGVGGVANVALTASDTIDILIATQTGTVTGGKVVVSALLRDLTVQQRGTVAQLKS